MAHPGVSLTAFLFCTPCLLCGRELCWEAPLLMGSSRLWLAYLFLLISSLDPKHNNQDHHGIPRATIQLSGVARPGPSRWVTSYEDRAKLSPDRIGARSEPANPLSYLFPGGWWGSKERAGMSLPSAPRDPSLY